MPRMKDGRPLPTALLVVRQFAEVSDDALPWAEFGALRLDQCEIAVSFAVLGPLIPAKKYPCLHSSPARNSLRASNYITVRDRGARIRAASASDR